MLIVFNQLIVEWLACFQIDFRPIREVINFFLDYGRLCILISLFVTLLNVVKLVLYFYLFGINCFTFFRLMNVLFVMNPNRKLRNAANVLITKQS